MFPWTYIFGAGCAATYWFAVRSRDGDVRTLAQMLTVIWALANLGWFYDFLAVLPVLDWTAGTVALMIWWARRTLWAQLFVHLVVARLSLHVLNYITSEQYLVAYLIALNALFVAQLAVVSYPGSGDVLNLLLRGLRNLRDGLWPSQAPEVKANDRSH